MPPPPFDALSIETFRTNKLEVLNADTLQVLNGTCAPCAPEFAPTLACGAVTHACRIVRLDWGDSQSHAQLHLQIIYYLRIACRMMCWSLSFGVDGVLSYGGQATGDWMLGLGFVARKVSYWV